MKLAVVGHSYIIGTAVLKFVALKQATDNATLRIFVPQRAGGLLGQYRPKKPEGLGEEEYVVCSSMLNGHPMHQVLDPWKLGRALQRFRPDILHIEEDPHSVMGAETLVLARLVSRRTKLSYFTWDNIARRPPFPKDVIKRRLTKLGFGRASLIICGNRDAQRLLYERKGYHGRSVVLPQAGHDNFPELAERRLAAARAARTTDPVTIGFAGRLVPEKGLLVLRNALERLGPRLWRLRLLGAGPLRSEIDTGWRTAFGDRLEVHEAVPHVDVPKHLAEMDIVVLHSLSTPVWKEQFGSSLANAMMTGCACVGSDSGAVPEVLAGAGIVTPEGDAEKLAEALVKLIDNPALRLELGVSARRHALAHYTHESVGRAHLAAFRELLADA
jgi:L-malate glycosyltransferase